jgi:hypothetical protein
MAEFDQLANVLYDGKVAAWDFKTMQGTKVDVPRDELAKSLLESMNRMGLIVDGQLINKIQPKA